MALSKTAAVAKHKVRPNQIWMILIIIVSVAVIVGGAIFLFRQRAEEKNITESTDNKYVEFISEVYKKVQQNYWDIMDDEKLFNLYNEGIKKVKEQMPEIQIPEATETLAKNSEGLKQITAQIMDQLDQEGKKSFAVKLTVGVLTNLEPFGRSGLYTTANQQDLTNRVYNIDPATDLYSAIGLNNQATQAEIAQAIDQQSAELKNVSQDETQSDQERKAAQDQLALVERAQKTLTDPQKRENYNTNKIESTILTNQIGPDIFYVKIDKFSPQTLAEFQQTIGQIDQEASGNSDSLILDLRGNVGGAFDILPEFLGLFMGKDQLGYDWYQQGQVTSFKTTADRLAGLDKFSQVIILIDNGTQSSAEVMAMALKKSNFGILVGSTTKGWGTIERIFELDNQIDPQRNYSLFLVHHLSLGETQQPIEGRGVAPQVDLTAENWPEQLQADYDASDSLINAVEEIWFGA